MPVKSFFTRHAESLHGSESRKDLSDDNWLVMMPAARGRQLTEPDRPSKTAVVVMDTSKSGRARFGYGS